MGLMCRLNCLVALLVLFSCGPVFSQDSPYLGGLQASLNQGASGNVFPVNGTGMTDSFSLPFPAVAYSNDYSLKLAYGKTFGTSTELDYATFELSRRVSVFPALTYWGPAIGEVQLATLASYVLYYEGQIERLKKLDFRDGYELAWIPKGRFTFPSYWLGVSPYVESGAGLSYVSETYRNSGSRWNWSLLGGFGFEKDFYGSGSFSLGVQWRHLSNGNMWGKGDELHNSNSGTDMIQGMASFIQRF
ncbi:MAG: acyloxyacyl hydrolase [Desulfomonile tiedjei]|uniref:Acyloxyacyl hydrolase n=1 Tax=Desulfomonile tiedjei TaxID=2358 RepID=A0A9D6V3H6_9BACT|nr:acyloxyacyl hydrolase [Desulfomonile tiedjei]